MQSGIIAREKEYQILFWTSLCLSLIAVLMFISCIFILIVFGDASPTLDEYNRQIAELSKKSLQLKVSIADLNGQKEEIEQESSHIAGLLVPADLAPTSGKTYAAPELLQDLPPVITTPSLELLKQNLQRLAADRKKAASSATSSAPRPGAELDPLFEEAKKSVTSLTASLAERYSEVMAAADRWLTEQQLLGTEIQWDAVDTSVEELISRQTEDRLLVLNNTVLSSYGSRRALAIADIISQTNAGIEEGAWLKQCADFCDDNIVLALTTDPLWKVYLNCVQSTENGPIALASIRRVNRMNNLAELVTLEKGPKRQALAEAIASEWVGQAIQNLEYISTRATPAGPRSVAPPSPTGTTEAPVVPELTIEQLLQLSGQPFMEAILSSKKLQAEIQEQMAGPISKWLAEADFPKRGEPGPPKLDAESPMLQAYVSMKLNKNSTQEQYRKLLNELQDFVWDVVAREYYGNSYETSLSRSDGELAEVIPKLFGLAAETVRYRTLPYRSSAADSPDTVLRAAIASYEQRVDRWRQRIAELDEKFSAEQQTRQKAERERLEAQAKQQAEYVTQLANLKKGAISTKAKLNTQEIEAAKTDAELATAKELRQQVLDNRSKFSSPTALGSIIGAVGAAVCQLVAGTVLLMLTHVGKTLTQWRQTELEQDLQAERISLLDEITNIKLKEETIATYITGSPIKTPEADSKPDDSSDESE